MRITVSGSDGMLAHGIVPYFKNKGHDVFGFDLSVGDITDKNWLIDYLKSVKPDIFINCAAYTLVDDCEKNKDRAFLVNSRGPAIAAGVCKQQDIFLIHFSTDYIFNGEKNIPYKETDLAQPLSIYGLSKLEGDQNIILSGCRYLIVRTSWLYGEDGNNFPLKILQLARTKDLIKVVADQRGCPTYTKDLVIAVDNILKCQTEGVFNFSNAGECSWYEFAEKIIFFYKKFGGELKVKNIIPCSSDEYLSLAKRPKYSVLDKTKYIKKTGAEIPLWEDSLEKFIKIIADSGQNTADSGQRTADKR